MQLAAPAAGEPEVLADIAARHAGPVAVTTARGGPAGTAMGRETGR
jgi:hypothetical protein